MFVRLKLWMFLTITGGMERLLSVVGKSSPEWGEKKELPGLAQDVGCAGLSLLCTSCCNVIFQASPTSLPFPISKGKMESNCASDADSPSHNISYTSSPDKPPFKMMYCATYLL